MIPRYTHPDMGRIWSEERRFETWLQVEIAAARVMADAGIIPKDAARDIAERSGAPCPLLKRLAGHEHPMMVTSMSNRARVHELGVRKLPG